MISCRDSTGMGLKRIEKRIQAFIWRGSIPKVAKALLRPKKEGGLSVWSLTDKARAFTSIWVVKFLQNNTNLILQDTIQAATNWYAVSKETKVPLWESRMDYSQDIEAAGFGLLVMLQNSWATVVRHEPDLLPGD
jgi:hypothetical protein